MAKTVVLILLWYKTELCWKMDRPVAALYYFFFLFSIHIGIAQGNASRPGAQCLCSVLAATSWLVSWSIQCEHKSCRFWTRRKICQLTLINVIMGCHDFDFKLKIDRNELLILIRSVTWNSLYISPLAPLEHNIALTIPPGFKMVI